MKSNDENRAGNGRVRLTAQLLEDLDKYIKINFRVKSDERFEGEIDKQCYIEFRRASGSAYQQPSEDGRPPKGPRPPENAAEKEAADKTLPADIVCANTAFAGAGKLCRDAVQPEEKAAMPAEGRVCASAGFDELLDRKPKIDEFIRQRQKPTFSQLLMSHIDARGEKDSSVYKRAQIDRRVFSKIRSEPSYHPSRGTALSLALALQLGRAEADELLAAAGYALSRSDNCDLVIAFCFEREIFNIGDVNMMLDYFNMPILGRFD